MEIIWGNKLKAGDYKYIDKFPHYVADGGNDNVGGGARKSICKRSIATFGRIARTPILSTLRFSAIPTRLIAAPSAILPM